MSDLPAAQPDGDGAPTATLADWRLARHVASTLAAGAKPRPGRDDAERTRARLHRIVDDVDPTVRAATGLGDGVAAPEVLVVGRSGWIRANLAVVAWITAPVAERLLRRSPAARQASQRVFGAQLGVVLGYLACRVLGQYEALRPTSPRGRLLLVGPNLLGVEELADEEGVDAEAVARGIVAHELAHFLQFEAVDWLRDELQGILWAYLDDVEVDRDRFRELARRIPELLADPRRARDPQAWLKLLLTPHQSALLDRAQSLMSVLEGHGNAAMDWAAARDERVGDPAEVRELLQRRREQTLDRLARDALGLSLKARQYRVGERFVLEVADRHGLDTLNRVWEGPEQLPTAEELDDPDGWVARTA